MQKYRLRYPERAKASVKKWQDKNREKLSQYSMARHVRKRSAAVGIVDYKKLYEEWDGSCGICKKKVEGKTDVDHIIPLSRGGKHSQDNLQVAHASCNRSKGAR